MQQGRGGMGSRKHGRSGRGGPSPKQKLNVAREANQELAERQAAERKRREAGLQFDSVSDAFRSTKKR